MSKKEFDSPTPDETMYEHSFDEGVSQPEQPYSSDYYGVVTNCERLNIRREPKKKNSEILCIVGKGTKLLINQSKSTIMWYSVTTETGVEGYAMKEYITV